MSSLVLSSCFIHIKRVKLIKKQINKILTFSLLNSMQTSISDNTCKLHALTAEFWYRGCNHVRFSSLRTHAL